MDTLEKELPTTPNSAGMKPLRVGIAGLGVASSQVLPAFRGNNSAYVLAGGADVRAEAREQFAKAFDRPTYDSVEAMARRDDVDAIWISTPNTLHAEHVVTAARHGKHVICEKPMAVTLAECDRMLRACEANGVKYLQGHSKIYQPPMRKMQEIIRSGRLGRVIQIQSMNSNDWLQRPRLAPEVDTTKGGGLVYRQGPHIVDIVRFLGGGLVDTVSAATGRADPYFDTEGHFSSLLKFANGAAATLTFNGYGWFDVTELTWDIGESGFTQTGKRRFPGNRPRLTGPANTEEKANVAHDRSDSRDVSERHQPFFGLTIVYCEKGAIRQAPDGILVYTENGREEVPCGGGKGRDAELQELSLAIAENRDVFPDGRWGKATLEVCLAMLESSKDGKVKTLKYQVPSPGFGDAAGKARKPLKKAAKAARGLRKIKASGSRKAASSSKAGAKRKTAKKPTRVARRRRR
ncbi:MAG TPA: Gfo/Idh/MocA family oxidoreductase [Alphaproteobacteria bacterium]|nr:Gfo/Idh/MocA family oxidoreductase [Alphaproteobacteria bacterium]